MRLIRVRPEEAPTALLMTLYFFLAMASVSVVKSLQNALYLGSVGFDWRLPALYIVLALVSGAGVVLFRRLARTHSRIGINRFTLIGLMLSLLLLFFALSSTAAWVYTLFYLWGGIFSVLVPTQGWMLSYDLYSTRSAKRLFAVLGTGGILGGATGGYYAAFMAGVHDDTRLLLIHVVVILAVMQGVLIALRRLPNPNVSFGESPAEGRPADDGISSTLGFLFGSSYLRRLALLILATAAGSTLVDLLYKWALEERFSGSPEDITEFFGTILGTMFIFSALFQLLATSRILRSVGVGMALLVLPLMTMAGSVAVVVLGAFFAVVGLKLLDGCLRTSLDKTSVEVLYVTMADERTITVKGIIDLVVFRMGDALGATIFLLLASLPTGTLRTVGAGLALTALGWAAVAWMLGGEYLRNLRRSLEVRPTPGQYDPVRLDESIAPGTLVAALQSSSSAKVHFALRQLIVAGSGRVEIELGSQGQDLAVPRLQLTAGQDAPPWLDIIEPLVYHHDLEVASAAMHLLVSNRPEEYATRLATECQSDELPATLCLVYLDRYQADLEKFLEPQTLLQWAGQAEPERAVLLARLMGRLRAEDFLSVLHEWTNHPRRRVARAAIRALGQFQRQNDLEVLLQSLASNWKRHASREAVAQFGPAIVPHLLRLVRDPDVELGIRREIPWILARIRNRQAMDGLVTALYLDDPVISFRALKGLNRIRARHGLPFGEVTFSPVLQIWVREYYELLNLQHLAGVARTPSHRLLCKAIQERRNRVTEKLFRGLELFLPPGDAYFSYLGFTGSEPGLRENAIELIDLRIRGELRETILPIITGLTDREILRTGRRLYELATDRLETLSDALFLDDPWLKCCIIAAVRSEAQDSLRPRIEQAREDINPVVRETAFWALETWGR